MNQLSMDLNTIIILLTTTNIIMILMLFIYGISTNFDSSLKNYIYAKLFQLSGVFIIPLIINHIKVITFEIENLFYFFGIALETYCIIFINKNAVLKIKRIYFLISIIFLLITFFLLIEFHQPEYNKLISSLYEGFFLIICGTALLFYNNNTGLKKISGSFFYIIALTNLINIVDVVSNEYSISFLNRQLTDSIYFLFVFIHIILSTMVYLFLHREKMYLELKNAATIDFLTGIHNRREAMLLSTMLMKLMVRQKKPITILMLDLDMFKSINDKYGHVTGDKVLVHFAKSVNSLIREQDIFGRYGGEEFIIFLPDTSKDKTKIIAERIRAFIEKGGIKFEKNIKYTVSIGGFSIFPDSSINLEDMIKTADDALYKAKQTGRNKVIIK